LIIRRKTMPTSELAPLQKKEGNINFKVTGPSGDDRFTWDRRDLDQIKQARDKFYDLLKKGYLAFGVNTKGQKHSKMGRFDPDAEEVIFVAPVVGG
jgi:hypothetical protein